ncbi:MAG: hypothetical protein ABSH53_20140 [Holophaga sp.]|jgi:hypothetical protein
METRRAILAVYDQGAGIYQAQYWLNFFRLASAWAVRREEDRAWRAGAAVTLEDRRYGTEVLTVPATGVPPPPVDSRRQRGPALTLEYQEDAFQTFQDIQGMDVAEDYNLAWGGSVELGSYSRRRGSTRPGPYLKLQVTRGWAGRPRHLTLLKGRASLRGGGVDAERLKVESSLATYYQASPAYALAGYLALKLVRDPDPENLLYVGGAEGLRGYRNFIHPGDGQVLFSVENRFFTEQRWWGLFRLGFVGFLDAGAVRRIDGHGWSPVYPDLGVGLRLGDLKSSMAKVVALTVSVLLAQQPGQSRWQFGIQNTARF